MVQWHLPACFRPSQTAAKDGPKEALSDLAPPNNPSTKGTGQSKAMTKQGKVLTPAASQGNLAAMLGAAAPGPGGDGGGGGGGPAALPPLAPAAPDPSDPTRLQPQPSALQRYTSSYSSRGPAGSKSNGSETGASLCSLNSKSPSVATRCTAPTPGSSVFELSTSGLLAQRRACILRPMASAYARSSETDIVKTLGQRGNSTKGSVEGSEHESLYRQGSGLPRALSVGSCLSRQGGSGASSSLMMASFARMQGHLIAADAAASAAAAGGDAPAQGAAAGDGCGPADPQAPSRSASVSPEDEATARRFAQAYLQAVTSGNGEWASAAAVQEAFDDNAKLCTHDGQKYHGRAAVIKRLNQGMQQFLKMVGHQAGGGEQASSLMSSKLHTQLEIKLLPAGSARNNASAAGAAGAPWRLKKGARALNVWVKSLVPGKRQHAGRGGLQGSASMGSLGSFGSMRDRHVAAAAAPAPPAPPSLVAVYTFKYGIRRMTVTDTMRFRSGRIVRMKRVFKL